MPDRTEVRIGEYGSALLAYSQLTPRDVKRLRALQAHGRLGLDQTPTGWRLKAGATVGLLVLDRVRLVMEPKFALPGDRLMDWLAYALGAPAPLPVASRHWATGPEGYADLVAAALLEQCERLLREGLRRDYVRRQSLEPVLRGRLDVAAQATLRYGQLDKLHIRTFDRETDIWDNRVLGTALQVASALTTSPDLTRDLHTIADAFPKATPPDAALRALDRTRYTPLNARYRAAHIWSRLLLRGGGVTDILTDRGTAADGLLLAMPALWEAVVRRLVTDAAAPHGGRGVPSSGAAGITVRGDLGITSAFRPDVLLSLPDRDPTVRALLPVDAKYKRYDRHGVGAEDVHQLLTYSAAYTPGDDRRAVIVHPRAGGHSYRALRVDSPRGRLGNIHVLGIGTHALPQEAAAWVGSVLPLTDG
ncbi:McrC family protein [Streptomyces sp. NBC_00557]|uniref:McrC family protein n=1 Tax=Streptomyces sp. NBC_00557 TaxID=2975776 RepID=UPI002E8153C0|nr:PE-PGRS family protein [Streptomyces sp. NBC_00557]WUC33768.1 McrC family protein [Streptomyces sp. NBC_00557]